MKSAVNSAVGVQKPAAPVDNASSHSKSYKEKIIELQLQVLENESKDFSMFVPIGFTLTRIVCAALSLFSVSPAYASKTS